MSRGHKHISETHPDWEALWDEEANGYPFYECPIHSQDKSKYHWILSCGHKVFATYQALMSYTADSSKKSHRNCPVCTNKAVQAGVNDIATKVPELLPEWDDERDPTSVLYTSATEAHWKCPKGHHYTMQVWRRTGSESRGCPVCVGKKLVVGVNDLLSLHPDVAAEYSDKNDKPVAEVLDGSHAKVWWKCKKYGHEWQATVKSRTRAGNGCPTCSNRVFLQGFNDLATLYPKLVSLYSPENEKPASQVPGWGKSIKYKWVCENGHTWEAVPDNVIGLGHKVRGSRCPYCVHHVSATEQDLTDYVQGLLPDTEILTNQRVLKEAGTRGVSELDIMIPSKHLAFEFNGTYYHTERFGRDKYYHRRKRRLTEELGYQLITIWEDVWVQHPTATKRLIQSKLGVLSTKTVGARKTQVVHLNTQDARTFLDTYHIQGFATGEYYLGLEYAGEVVACMVLQKRGGTSYNLSRYATSCSVPGGHSKLISWVSKNTKITDLVTFADLDVSSGELYSKTGWVLDSEIEPDYQYVVGGDRVHKFNYRKQRFKDDPNLEYQEGLTELELATLNGLYRAWDSGKLRYTKNLKEHTNGVH